MSKHNKIKKEVKTEEVKTEEVKTVEVIDWEDDDGFCKFCGWCSDYPASHAEHSMRGWGFGKQTGCKYMESVYKFEIIDGEMEWVKK